MNKLQGKSFNVMKKYVIRANEKFIFESFERSFVSALLGSRRVGKTTLLNYYMKLHPNRKWVSLNMDILSQRKRVANEELKILIEQEALQKIGVGEKIWVFIDEAQKCPELFDQVKILYDTFKDQNKLKFILTGSAHLNLHQLTAESLAGRVELLHLREFNLRELTLLTHPNLQLPTDTTLNILFDSKNIKALEEIYESLKPFERVFVSSLESQLLWGGLPETFVNDTMNFRLKYLSDYLQTYLEKDIRAIETISDLSLFENLMKICAELTGSLRDDKKISDALHCSRNTLYKYRNYLLATLQYTEIYPLIDSTVKRLIKSPKGYLVNNGLISYLTGIHDLSILRITGGIGHRFENWLLNEIQTWMDSVVERHQIHFWRTSSGAEVDFVLTLGTEIMPVEVTYSSQIDSKKFNGLKSFLRHSPKSTLGIFCYTGPLTYDQEHRILFLPAWML